MDLHCHLLYGLDDGAKTLEDSLEMARALVDLGFSTVAASPHNRPEYADKTLALERMHEVEHAFEGAGIRLALVPNAESFFLDDQLLASLGTERFRGIGPVGKYLLVEAPYRSTISALPDIIFRLKLKGVTPLIAHPERCMEFEKKGRAEELVRAGARLQLDVGALIGRYGPVAKKLSRQFLEDGLYSVGATDLHAPHDARGWVGKALAELKSRAGESGLRALLETQPEQILRGEALELDLPGRL